MRPCNQCDQPARQRVEIRFPTSRLLVCARCAVNLAGEAFTRGERCTILPFAMPRQSVFVAGDEFYSPNTTAVDAHQRELEATARRYADRIRGVISRALQVRQHAAA